MTMRSAASAIASVCLSFAVATCAQAQPAALNVDDIIARHIEARGGADAMRNIRTLVFDDGTYSEGDYVGDGDAVMMISRPYYKLVGHPERDPGYMEGYDGAAWEWFADPGVVVRTVGRPSEAIRHGADVESAFLDYAEKGYTHELIGEALIDGKPAYQVRSTAMDGTSGDSFIDKESLLVVAARAATPIHAFGAAVERESRFGDYREVAGVLFWFRDETFQIATGERLSGMQWGTIEANVDIPEAWFSPPEFERSRIQTFIEQLYIQRADPPSVMWTYHAFRRAYPGESTQVASEVAGFQSLKMGAVETAIVLLEQNAADYPDAADSAFGLGRAYATVGRTDDARAEFERALRLEPGHVRATRAMADLDN